MNSTPATPLRVTAYLRVSTPGQVMGRDFGSLEKQLSNAKEMCLQHANDNWVFVREYRDAGITGTDDSRPRLKELMAAAERHEFDIVIFQFLDRLSRHAAYTLQLLERLRELGIDVYDSDGQRVDISTADGLVKTGIGALLAEASHKTMVRATLKGVRTNASKGFRPGGMDNFGYDKDLDRKKRIAPSPTEGPIMVEAFIRLAGGEDLADVVSDFRSRELRTKVRIFNKGREDERHVGAKLFSTDILERMIRNPVYRGMHRSSYDEKTCVGIAAPVEMDPHHPTLGLYRGLYEALVSDEIWWRANINLDRRNKRKMPSQRPSDPEGRFLLQGMLRCGCCKCQMTTTYTFGHTGAKFYYYKCQHHIEEGERSGCSVRALPANLLHTAVLGFLTRVIMHPDVIEATLATVKDQRGDEKGQHQRELKQVNAQLLQIRAEISNCVDAVTKKHVPALLADLQARATQLKAKEHELSQRQQELLAICRTEIAHDPDAADVMATLNDFSVKARKLTGVEKKELVKLLLKDVTVFTAKPREKGQDDTKKTKCWRFLIRLRLDSLRPVNEANGTLPMQFTGETPKGRSGWVFRFIEPFDGIEVESAATRIEEDSAPSDQEQIAAHPLIMAKSWSVELKSGGAITQASIAQRSGLSRSLVSRYLKLLGLEDHVLVMLTSKPSAKILRYFSYRKLKHLLSLDPKQQRQEFREALLAANPARS